jgi:hypothetical protein
LIFFPLLSCGQIRGKPTVTGKEKPVIIEKECCLRLGAWESLARHEDFEILLKQKQESWRPAEIQAGG